LSLTGQLLGHYRILEKLGEGGMGVVYRAHDERLDRDVAVKVLPEEVSEDSARLERFEREARAAAALDHPNILAIHELGSHGGRTFIVTELLDGQTVRQAIEAGDLSNRRVVGYAIQVANALAAAHERGVVHRDLKPENLFITADGNVKILDFGLARRTPPSRDDAESSEDLTEEMLTRAGTVMGTSGYMSPEQVRGQVADHRSDFFSFGVVLYEMLTGLSPFRRVTAADTASAVISEDPPPVSETTSTVTPAFDGVVRRCLEKRPEDRFQSARDLAFALQSLLEAPVTLRRERSGPRIPYKPLAIIPVILAAALAFALLHTVYKTLLEQRPPQSVGADPPRVVVLPFENLGPSEEAYFADGVTEEITARLSAVSGLRVISRTTAVQYQRGGRTVPEIGADLGVDYLIEGTVRWAGEDRIRITPQLIKVSEDSHLWADTYDRVIEDVFAVQSDIARRVVEILGIELLGDERRLVELRPTDDLDAYQAYLQGRWYANRPHFTLELVQRMLTSFQRATELDPSFALAHGELAKRHAELHFYGHDLSQERLDAARESAGRALALAPVDPRVHLALAYYYLRAFRDIEAARAELEIAAHGLPNSAEVLLIDAYICEVEGCFEVAVEALERAMEISPLDPSLPAQAGFSYWPIRRFQDAIRVFDRTIEMAPESGWPYLGKAFVHWSGSGDTVASRAALEALPVHGGAWTTWTWYWQELFDDRPEDAIRRLEEYPGDWIRSKMWARPKSLMRATVFEIQGRDADARKDWESALSMLGDAVVERPDDPRLHSSLGIVYAALGRLEEAVIEGQVAIDLLPLSKDAFYGLSYEVDLARILMMVGDHEAALDQLERLLCIPSWVTSAWLEVDPLWDPLREHPRYRHLKQSYGSSI
jgi:serine/threonine-protein kinase